MAALEPAIYIPHHLKLRQTSRGDEKEKDKPPSCETVNKSSLNYLHESRLFQQVMSANMSKEKLLPYIKLVSSPKVRYAKLILYQFPGLRHNISPGRPIGTIIQNPSKTDWVQVQTCDLSI